MAIGQKVTALYLKGPPMNLPQQERLYKTLTRHGFGLYPDQNPFWVKFEDIDNCSGMCVFEGMPMSFPTFFIRTQKDGTKIVRSDYRTLIIPSDQGIYPESRKTATDRLRAILSELEFEVVQEETK